MTIASLDNYIASAKQIVPFCKTPGRTTVANGWFSGFDLAGNPGAGVLAGTSTAAGVVPDDTTAGTPAINPFGGAATGYLTTVDFGNTVACRIAIFDLLFKAGAYAFNASQALSAQPSFAAKMAAANGVGLQIWIEQVTAATLNQAVNVTYTNQAGTTTQTTGAVGIGAAPTVGRCWQLPLAAGDSGVQRINNVVGSTASAGTFNVLVLRPLWSGRVLVANGGDTHGIDKTGMPIVYATSALYMMVCADSTAFGVPELSIEIANN